MCCFPNKEPFTTTNKQQTQVDNFFAPIHVSHGMVVVVVVVETSGFLGHTKDRVPGGKSVQRYENLWIHLWQLKLSQNTFHFIIFDFVLVKVLPREKTKENKKLLHTYLQTSPFLLYVLKKSLPFPYCKPCLSLPPPTSLAKRGEWVDKSSSLAAPSTDNNN
jgi:hypothetical protein